MNLDAGNLLAKVEEWIRGLFLLLPNIFAALVIVAIFWLISHFVAKLVRRSAKTRGRRDLGAVMSALLQITIVLIGIMLAVTIILPSVKPADLISGLGIGSVAIGFAFKDILQNMLAGVLILIRQPFEVGDQIVSGGHEGSVEKIETRATFLKTYDGRRVVIPNSQIYTDSVVVNTAFEQARSQYDVGIGYGDGITEAKDVILKAVQGVEGVLDEPAAEVLVVDLSASWVTLRPRWWTDSVRTRKIHIQSQVIEAIKNALDDAGIDMPYDTQVQLFHDQTEEIDGSRGDQREGWPKVEDNPRPARTAIAEDHGQASANGGTASKTRKSSETAGRG